MAAHSHLHTRYTLVCGPHLDVHQNIRHLESVRALKGSLIKLTSTSSSSSSLTITSTSRFFVQAGMGFLLTCSTRSDMRMLNRSCAFLGGMNDDHSIETPCETICTSSLCSVLNQSTNSCRVGLLCSSKRSQSVHSTSPYCH